jgi:hypothetical protein
MRSTSAARLTSPTSVTMRRRVLDLGSQAQALPAKSNFLEASSLSFRVRRHHVGRDDVGARPANATAIARPIPRARAHP